MTSRTDTMCGRGLTSPSHLSLSSHKCSTCLGKEFVECKLWFFCFHFVFLGLIGACLVFVDNTFRIYEWYSTLELKSYGCVLSSDNHCLNILVVQNFGTDGKFWFNLQISFGRLRSRENWKEGCLTLYSDPDVEVYSVFHNCNILDIFSRL